MDNVGHHLFQFVEEGGCVVAMAFYLSQFLFPNAGQFGRLQQFFPDQSDEFHARGSGEKVFPLFADVVPLEEGLDDGGAGGGAADAVFLQGVAQFVVIHQFAGCFHGSEQGGFCIGFGRLGPLFE